MIGAVLEELTRRDFQHSVRECQTIIVVIPVGLGDVGLGQADHIIQQGVVEATGKGDSLTDEQILDEMFVLMLVLFTPPDAFALLVEHEDFEARVETPPALEHHLGRVFS